MRQSRRYNRLSSGALAIAAAFAPLGAGAAGLPTGGQVTAGAATITQTSATQLTVGDGTLANALPTQDAPRRGILVAPPGDLLGDEGDLELSSGGRPVTSPNPAPPLPGIEEASPDTAVSRASAQPTVHLGEPLEGGEGDGETPVPDSGDAATSPTRGEGDGGLGVCIADASL